MLNINLSFYENTCLIFFYFIDIIEYYFDPNLNKFQVLFRELWCTLLQP